MHEILRRLTCKDRVLDLGCAAGSFGDHECAATVIRADLDCRIALEDRQKGNIGTRFVCCDASTLPFADNSFNAIVLNHSLEHFHDPATVLSEIKRILRHPAFLYISVPDA